jgi:hypothetical protein
MRRFEEDRGVVNTVLRGIQKGAFAMRAEGFGAVGCVSRRARWAEKGQRVLVEFGVLGRQRR